MTLDANRQAIVRTYLGSDPTMSPSGQAAARGEVVENVDQTLDGTITPATPLPGPQEPECRRTMPPAWAR